MATNDTPLLRCAACGAMMEPDEAAPAPDGVPETLRYHASILACWAALAERPAAVSQYRARVRAA